MQDMTDLDAIAGIAAGREQGLRHLYDRHGTRIFRFALRLVRSEAIAEEVTNEVFIEVWKNAKAFEGRSAVPTWLLSIARNRALDRLRKRSEESLDEGVAERIVDGADDPEVELAKKDKGALMRLMIDRLSPIHREIVDLVYYHEQSIAEASAILGVPENTVKTRMFHARKQLSTLFNEAGLDRGWP